MQPNKCNKMNATKWLTERNQANETKWMQPSEC